MTGVLKCPYKTQGSLISPKHGKLPKSLKRVKQIGGCPEHPKNPICLNRASAKQACNVTEMFAN